MLFLKSKTNSTMLRIGGKIIFIFLIVFCTSCKDVSKDFNISGTTILLNEENVPEKDLVFDSIIHLYRESLEADMNRLLVYSAHVMERGTPEGKLNNFVADLVFDKGKRLYNPDDGKSFDFCLLNYGGLRVPLPKGEITYARVFELLPFENEMVVLTISGEKTLELFQYLARSAVGMPISGARLVIKDGLPESIRIQGKEFDINRNYKVLTSDYLAGGGDNMDFFLQPLNYELLGMKVRDAIIAHMNQVHLRGEMIQSELDGRISYLQ